MASDPYKYFRIEARDLLDGLGQGILELERGGATRAVVGRLLRLAHTLKGAARVVRQVEIAELAHTAEDLFGPFRESENPVPPERIHDVLSLLDAMETRLKALEPQSEPEQDAATQAPTEELFRSVRVAIDDIDKALDGVAEASVSLEALRKSTLPLDDAIAMSKTLCDLLAARQNGELERAGTMFARARSLSERVQVSLQQLRRKLVVEVERTRRDIVQVRDTTRQLRLVPTSAAFASLERTARDAAESLKKRIRFEAAGGDTHIDAHILGALRDALLHVVRNAVAHGIENEADRLAAGKPTAGLVQLNVERRGPRIAFICKDDGRGFDLQAIRQEAIRRQLVSPPEKAASLDLEEAVGLVFQGGITTTKSVTEISGRGVGLEVVRDITARLKGDVTAHTETGRGTTVEICVPVSLTSIATLLVDAGGMVASLPMDSIRGALRVTLDQIARSPEGETILFEEEVIPFLPLAAALEMESPMTRSDRPWSVAVIRNDARLAAIGIDRIVGTSNIVMKPLPSAIAPVPSVAGASFDEEGNPHLLLDPAGLVAAVRAGRGPLPPPAPVARPRLLVIDDSLTTRMLEQSILESAGYEVDVAVSGEEALDRVRQRHYALFVVDVEMPGIDGFEFIRRTKHDPTLREIPSILVTSRASAEDRRRGEEAGAQAYIVKSEFDEAGLLQRIHNLTSK